MSNKSTKKRHSAPSAAAGSQAQLMAHGWMPQHQMYYPWAGQASTSQAGGGPLFAPMPYVPQPQVPQSQAVSSEADSKPWDTDESDDSDFESPKPKKKTKSSNAAQGQGKKRGRPPTKALKAKSEFLAALPAAPKGNDDISFHNTKETCKGCMVYYGKFALFPCGHGKFCTSCVLKLHEGAQKTLQFCKCPLDNCFVLAKDWVQLYNVSG